MKKNYYMEEIEQMKKELFSRPFAGINILKLNENLDKGQISIGEYLQIILDKRNELDGYMWHILRKLHSCLMLYHRAKAASMTMKKKIDHTVMGNLCEQMKRNYYYLKEELDL